LEKLRPFDYEQVGGYDDIEKSHRSPKTDVKISPQLHAELKLLRKGAINNRDKRWKKYPFEELSYAMRRGSDSLHAHLAAAMSSRLLQDRKRLALIQQEVTVRQTLLRVGDGKIEIKQVSKTEMIQQNISMQVLKRCAVDQQELTAQVSGFSKESNQTEASINRQIKICEDRIDEL
jgi:hypothetical protein